MKYFYDTEFLEGPQTNRFLGVPIGKTKPTIDLISIGIVSEDNREYYAVSKDFNLYEAWNRYDVKVIPTYGDMRNLYPEGKKVKEYWIRENVLRNIFDSWILENNAEIIRLGLPMNICEDKFTLKNFKKWLNIKGKSNKQIADEVFSFINKDEIPLSKAIEYGLKYTTNELYGYYSAYDHVVLSWLFGKMIDLPSGFPMYTKDLKQISDDLYDKKKEDYKSNGGKNFISKLSNHLDYPKQTNEHNALADAKWNKELYCFIQEQK